MTPGVNLQGKESSAIIPELRFKGTPLFSLLSAHRGRSVGAGWSEGSSQSRRGRRKDHPQQARESSEGQGHRAAVRTSSQGLGEEPLPGRRFTERT